MWLDLGTTDLEASKNFYGQLFGWEFEDLGPEAGGYNFARIGGKMVCGIGPAQKPEPGFVLGRCVRRRQRRRDGCAAEAAGAKVLAPAMDVMGSGRMAVLADPSGAVFTVWQPMRAHRHRDHRRTRHFYLGRAVDVRCRRRQDLLPEIFPVTTSDYDLGDRCTYTVFDVDGKTSRA